LSFIIIIDVIVVSLRTREKGDFVSSLSSAGTDHAQGEVEAEKISPMVASEDTDMAGTGIIIPVEGARLSGELILPPQTWGLVLFAHGSGSSRHSPRNHYVAGVLRESGLGTLLFDLLTPEEEETEAATRHLRFDIALLAERLVAATRWALDRGPDRDINVGYFGSSTGAAAALVAAARIRETVRAVVSRGGRPDLAGAALEQVQAATLLVVGGHDEPVIPLNEEAYARLPGQKALRIVPGASHLFEEPGTLEIVARMASEWFVKHFVPTANRRG
jgi:pimeloyl-ACP methyl ester carboxylesterase